MQTFRKLPTTVPMTNTPTPRRIRIGPMQEHGADCPSVEWQALGRSRGRGSASATSSGVRPAVSIASVGHLFIERRPGGQHRGDLGERARRRSARAARRPASAVRSAACGPARRARPRARPRGRDVRRSRRFDSRSTAPPPVARIAPGWPATARASVRSSQSRNAGSPELGEDRPDRPTRARLDLDDRRPGTAGRDDRPGSGRRSTCPCPGSPPGPGRARAAIRRVGTGSVVIRRGWARACA